MKPCKRRIPPFISTQNGLAILSWTVVQKDVANPGDNSPRAVSRSLALPSWYEGMSSRRCSHGTLCLRQASMQIPRAMVNRKANGLPWSWYEGRDRMKSKNVSCVASYASSHEGAWRLQYAKTSSQCSSTILSASSSLILFPLNGKSSNLSFRPHLYNDGATENERRILHS